MISTMGPVDQFVFLCDSHSGDASTEYFKYKYLVSKK